MDAENGLADTGNLPLTRMQRNLVVQIRSYNPKASDIYTGMLHAVHGKMHPGRTSAIAYGLRDAIDALARTGQEDEARVLRMDERLMLLASVLDRGVRLEDRFGTECQALAGMHSVLGNVAAGRRPAAEEWISSAVSQAEGILYMLTASRPAADKAADAIMSGPPTPDGAAKLVGMMSDETTKHYIIGRLPPSWLDCMADAGLFSDPGKGYWGSHRYLHRCVDEDPDAVAKIIASYDPLTIGENSLLYVDVLEFTLLLDAGRAGAVAGRLLEDGLPERFEYDPERYFGVARRMYKEGRHELATGLLRGALSSLEDPGAHGVHEWTRVQLERTVRGCMGGDLMPLVSVMADLLDGYIGEGAGDTAMSAERPTIADSAKNCTDSIKTAMITHIRDCLAAIGSGGGDLRSAMGIISGRKHDVWRRMEMHVYSMFPDFDEEMAEYAFRYMWEEGVQNEYLAMLGRLGSMQDDVKRRIQSVMMKGPGDGEPDPRRLRRLEAAAGWLDVEHLVTYDELAGRNRVPGAPDDAAPSKHDKQRMIDILASYALNPTQEALDEFTDFVKAKPYVASSMGRPVAGADGRIQSKFFGGLEDALRKGGGIDWDGVMPLLGHVASEFSDDAHADSGPAIAACHMLRAFMRRKKDTGPRKDILEVAIRLAGASSGGGRASQLDGSAFTGSLDGSSFAGSLNGVGGLTFHVMVLYVLWDTGDGLAQEARRVIDAYLGKPERHTMSRNAVLGAYMPSLHNVDGAWAGQMTEYALRGPCRDGFWNGYVLMNRPYADLFPVLAKWYDRFLNETGTGNRMHVATFYHVFTAYMHGTDETTEIIERFLGSVDPNMADLCIPEVAMAVKTWKGPDVDWGRMEALWTNDVFRGKDLSEWFIGCGMDRGMAIRMYGGYVEWSAAMGAGIRVTDALADELAGYAEEFPTEVGRIIGLLEEIPADGYLPPGLRHIRDALEGGGGPAG